MLWPFSGVPQLVSELSFVETVLEVNTLSCRCSECLAPGSACGWCVINSFCTGVMGDCLNTANFLQVMRIM